MTDVDARTARRRKLIGGGLVVAFTAVLIAIVVVRSAGEKVLNENGDTLVLVGERTGDGMDALGRGALADVGGCLGWAGTDGSAGTVVVWPHGTTITTADPLRISVDGRTYGLGDTIEVGGGDLGQLEPSNFFYNKVPAGCRDAEVFLANNN